MAASSAPAPALRWVIAAVLAVGLVVAALRLHGSETYGRAASWALASGALFGVLLQRSRFCFYCGVRELIEERDGRPVLGLLAALAVGTIGTAIVFGAWVPFPEAGHLPPRAHIGPAGWHLLVGGLAFGVGMAFSGSCLSAHLYRLGEGSVLAPIALLGAWVGFGLGFNAWEFFYVRAVTEAPVWWLPARLGYAGSLLLQLAVIGALAVWVWRRSVSHAPVVVTPRSVRDLARAVFITRWPHWVGGVGVGLLATAVYLRAAPLGVTAELGRLARQFGQRWQLVPASFPGLDGLPGCATGAHPPGTLGPNALFVIGLVVAALASGVAAGQFQPERPTALRAGLALLGGALLGFGAMISLGCSIGTLLSGIHALSLSGWLFALAMIAGIVLGLRVRRRLGA